MATTKFDAKKGIVTWTGTNNGDIGWASNDYIWKMDGKGGDDILTGGHNDDIMIGGTGNDMLSGNDGADLLKGDLGIDSLYGGAGSDVLYGGIGNDILDGGAGDDVLYLENYGDVLHGGDGIDVLNASTYKITGKEVGLKIDAGAGNYAVGSILTKGAAVTFGQAISFDGIESFVGSMKNDTITAGATTTVIVGGAGSDILTGYGNVSVLLQGDAGADTLNGSAGDDTLFGGKDKDLVYGNAGNDILFGDAGDTLLGGAGNDTFYWSANLAKVDGGDGDGDVNTLTAIATEDITIAGITIKGVISKGVTIDLEKEGTGTYGVHEGKKAFVARYENIDKVIGTNSNDKITASNAGTVLDGRGGDDILTGGMGNDVFYFDSSYGKDVVKSQDNGDFVLLGDHLTFTDIKVSRGTKKESNNLIIKTAFADTLTVVDYFKDGAEKPYIIDSNGNVFDIAAAVASTSGKVVDASGKKIIDAVATADVQNSGALPTAVASMVSNTYEFTIGGTNLDVKAGNHTNDSLKVNAPAELFDYAKFLATDASGIGVAQTGQNLELNFGTGQGTITLAGYYADGAKNITKVELPTVFGATTVLSGFKATSNAGGATAGTASDDFIYGLGGNDTIAGNGGHDFLYGGAGNDVISAAGSSMLIGGTGNDQLTGSASFDVLAGGDGNDALVGGAGRDLYVFGGTSWGNDVIADSGENYVAFVNKTMPNKDVLATVIDGHVVVTAGDSSIDLGTSAVAGDFRFVFGNPDANNSALYKIDINGGHASFTTTDTTVNLHKDIFGKLF